MKYFTFHSKTSVFFLLLFLFLVFISTRGIVYSDEGYILNSASRLLDGQLPYKDFHFVYTPLSIYLTAFAFCLFGQSLLVERLLAVFIGFTSCIFVFLLLVKLTKRHLLSMLGTLFFCSWTFFHINFVWPVTLSILTGLATLFIFVHAAEKKKGSWFITAGILTALTVLAKQNFGVVLLFNVAFAFDLNKGKRKSKFVLFYALGLFTCMGLYCIYLLATHSFISFIDDFYMQTVIRIIIKNDVGTPFIQANSFVSMIGKALVYLLPFAIGVFSLFYTLKNKRQRKYFFISTFVILYYISGIRPTTDYVHLSPLLGLSAIPLIQMITLVKKKKIALCLILLTIVLVFAGLYTALFKGYYRWYAPLFEQTLFVNDKKVAIWLGKKDYETVQKLRSFIQSKTRENDYIYVNEYFPMVYFVTQRKNPTPHDVISASPFYKNDRPAIIKDIEEKRVTIVVTPKVWQQSNLSSYVAQNFIQQKTIGDFIVWEKKQ